MRRTVRIFGRSIPLAAFQAAVVVVGALAWALFYLSLWHVSGTTGQAAPDFTWTAIAQCRILAPPGAITCTLNPEVGPSASMTNVTDTTSMQVAATLRNDDADPIYACLVSPTSPYGTYGGGPHAVGPIAPGASADVSLVHYFTTLTPGTAISYDAGWRIQEAACP